MASRIRRVLAMPRGVVARRLGREALAEMERFWPPKAAGRPDLPWLLSQLATDDLAHAWDTAARRAYPSAASVAVDAADEFCTGGTQAVIEAGGRALRRKVQLLGATVDLGDPVDWHRDYQTGFRWPVRFHRTIDYHGRGTPSDVKFPWEVSRFHWLLPVAQAYQLSGAPEYATAARELVEDWIDKNPYGMGINWGCAMDVALRAISWTWLFRSFHDSGPWRDSSFRYRFLASMLLHGVFVERHLEESDLNSNHYLADAAGLVFLGLFLGEGKLARRWSSVGWKILDEEARRQILPDGVDYEGSVAYHRLVMECLLYPALYRRALGLHVSSEYWDRLRRMARFVAAYSRTDGTSPLVGDADDGRVLPLGRQALLDHRYLVGLVGVAANDPDLIGWFDGPLDEIYWSLGATAARTLRSRVRRSIPSAAFGDGGFFVMRDERGNHVFVDCGPVGLSNRGGHGHNDCLSFEAALLGIRLVSDSGTLTYTGSYSTRNRFRATSAHNTPWLDCREINRFLDPGMLWSLRPDATPTVHEWSVGADIDVFRGSHDGYGRLPQPVIVSRRIVLHHLLGAIAVQDDFTGHGVHRIEIPLHLASDVEVDAVAGQEVMLHAGAASFVIGWEGTEWTLDASQESISPSYGVATPSWTLRWRTRAPVPVRLRYFLAPVSEAEAVRRQWGQWLNGDASALDQTSRKSST